MIDLIIFSRDRAFQLEALLRSLKQNCDIFEYISVIVKWTNDDHYKAYEKLSDDYPYVEFVMQQDLKIDVLSVMQHHFTCFMVDDMICYNKVTKPTSLNGFYDSIWCLRLGEETKGFTRRQWAWQDWQETKSYFDYPCSLDGNIYPTEIIKPIIQDVNFINPNKLEVMLWGRRERLPKILNCWGEAKVVSLPLNRVSETATASYGETHPHTTEELNERYLKGEVMDFDSMDFSNITVPHKEIEPKFKQL